MAQITKESMQEQRAAEAWFHTQAFIPIVSCQINSYESYQRVYMI